MFYYNILFELYSYVKWPVIINMNCIKYEKFKLGTHDKIVVTIHFKLI